MRYGAPCASGCWQLQCAKQVYKMVLHHIRGGLLLLGVVTPVHCLFIVSGAKVCKHIRSLLLEPGLWLKTSFLQPSSLRLKRGSGAVNQFRDI